MPYSEFSLAKVKKTFEFTTSEKPALFAATPELTCSEITGEILNYNVPLALASNSEKARSEMIITPILIEVRKQLQSQISLFSGIDFTVEQELGLNGYCDFIFSSGLEQLFVSAPVMMLVEAKNEDLKGGIGQCVAEMYAAQIFNLREGQEISRIYGAVTSGTNWKFLRLTGKVVEIDLSEYYLASLNKILGIMVHSIRESLNLDE
ncbi:MAG: hypothetical protein DSM107014_15400 [Gomphosphaeria aponina SAG 52.96 = DSM 107014]|uniref:Uncharacterized protein n=1 Tax=Gomphosphaeria aponina SAG 52.96 = DSM 107014 TaxID=1521640 RepID=A0A941JNF2_9CHRO|nr:hypothetical protein [Gomphosphaeria aponina SAG 52.96 = DSM 107014]